MDAETWFEMLERRPPGDRMTAVKLRPYQLEDVGAVLDAWGSLQRPAMQWATGLGKTVALAEIARINKRAFNMRTCVFVHRDELVRQTVDKLQAADSDLTVGIVQGGHMGIYADVVVASMQTLIRRLHKIPRDQFPRIIVDECHHAAADSYMRSLQHFGAFDESSPTKALGVTATMARGDRQGLGAVWEKVVAERPIAWGVEHGYLCPAEVRTVALAGLDTDRVRKTAGDLAQGDLGKAMSSIHAGERIAQAYRTYGMDALGGFRRAISFAPTIDIAEAWAGDYEAVGARCAVITGATPIGQRQAAYADVAAGRKDVLSSVMVLTEGFDLPAVEVAIGGRPTKSVPLLTQMVGRVLRPSPSTGKTSALLLDVVGALGGGLARSHDLSIPGPERPEAPPQDPDAMPRFRERIEIQPPPKVEWLAMDLLGQPIKAVKRRKTHHEPAWLRTYGGVAFLPQTPDFPWRVFCWVRPDSATPWWRLEREAREPEPLELAPGGDPRELHPGLPLAWEETPCSGPQAELLRRLALPVPETKLKASESIEIHFASASLDRICRPKHVGPVTPPPGVK